VLDFQFQGQKERLNADSGTVEGPLLCSKTRSYVLLQVPKSSGRALLSIGMSEKRQATIMPILLVSHVSRDRASGAFDCLPWRETDGSPFIRTIAEAGFPFLPAITSRGQVLAIWPGLSRMSNRAEQACIRFDGQTSESFIHVRCGNPDLSLHRGQCQFCISMTKAIGMAGLV
jgi:hypothetical protein